MTRRGRERTSCAVLVLIAVLASGVVRAQEPERSRPLTKSELVRLLVDSSLEQTEIAEVVRRSCLTFDPGDRDLADLERAGAGPPVLSEVVACGRRTRLSFASDRALGRAGGIVAVEARAERAGEPAGGLRLRLEEGGETVASGRTDDSGRVRFRIPSGTTVRRRSLRLRAGSVPPDREPVLTLDVRPGAPDRAILAMSPDSADTATARVTARVRDAFGNSVPGVAVVLVSGSRDAGRDTLRPEGRTGDDGEVRFRVPAARLPAETPLLLVHDGETLAASRPPPAVARAATAGARREGEASGRAEAATPDRAAADGDAPAADRADADGPPSAARGDELELAPGLLDLEKGRSLHAVAWFRRAVERRPGDGEAWTGLARAWLAAGEPALAREAFQEGRRRAEDSVMLEEAVRDLGGLPPWARLQVFGGGAWREGEVRDFGALEATVHPLPELGLWGSYESTLGSHDPFLVRGGSDVPTLAGGLSVAYGPERSVTTGFSMARLDHGGDVHQLVYRLRSELRLSAGGRPVRWRIGGTLGRWWDRDDWTLSTEVEVPVAPEVALVPSVHVGETSGTAVAQVGRLPATELRAQLEVMLAPSEGVSLAPALAYGRVSPLDEFGFEDAGDLLEARFRLSVRLGPSVSFLVRGRHQRPPFAASFSDLAAGLSYELR